MGVNRAIVLIGVGLLTGGQTAGVAVNGPTDPEFRSAGSRQNTVLKEGCPANQFPPIQLAFASIINERLPGTTTSIRCTTKVRNDGEPQRGIPIMLGGELMTGDGDPIRSLPTRRGRTNGAGQKAFTFPYSPPPSGDDIVAIMEGVFDGDEEIDSADTTYGIIQKTPCNNSNTQACLLGNRFKVDVDWRTNNQSGAGMVVSTSKTDAFFYFFNPNSTDLLVQLLNRCSNNDHYWVLAAAQTNVEFDLTVTDTFSGVSRSYGSPLGGMVPVITDTSAFATCP